MISPLIDSIEQKSFRKKCDESFHRRWCQDVLLKASFVKGCFDDRSPFIFFNMISFYFPQIMSILAVTFFLQMNFLNPEKNIKYNKSTEVMLYFWTNLWTDASEAVRLKRSRVKMSLWLLFGCQRGDGCRFKRQAK